MYHNYDKIKKMNFKNNLSFITRINRDIQSVYHFFFLKLLTIIQAAVPPLFGLGDDTRCIKSMMSKQAPCAYV